MYCHKFIQEHFQKELIANLDIFQEDCGTFVNEYYDNGPMQPGLTPREASDRLQMFQVIHPFVPFHQKLCFILLFKLEPF